MVGIKVSEKTLELLKLVKDEEQIKTLDGSIRYLLSAFDMLKMASVRWNEQWIPILSPHEVWRANQRNLIICPECEREAYVKYHPPLTEGDENTVHKQETLRAVMEKSGSYYCVLCGHTWEKS